LPDAAIRIDNTHGHWPPSRYRLEAHALNIGTTAYPALPALDISGLPVYMVLCNDGSVRQVTDIGRGMISGQLLVANYSAVKPSLISDNFHRAERSDFQCRFVDKR